MELGLCLDFFDQSLFFIVCVDVAVLAHPFRVVHPLRVFAFSGVAFTPVPVIAVVAHALCEMLQRLVGAVCNHTGLPSTLRYSDVIFDKTIRRFGHID